MGYYGLTKSERAVVAQEILKTIAEDLKVNSLDRIKICYADDDTYIRKNAYLATGKLYAGFTELKVPVLAMLHSLFTDEDFRIRQTVINAAGEIGKKEFDVVRCFFDDGLSDPHHSPRNAVIGSMKKISRVNPDPLLLWAKTYLHHPEKEIRREICHGIELRGRTHPQDILPLLRELQFDQTLRVRRTLVHVIGQISYKKGCLQVVVQEIKKWQDKELISEAFKEIIDVHHRYRNFATLTQEQAMQYIAACSDLSVSL
jgi:hypothetical protein